jgi:predicted ABC-type ATPase
VPDPVLHLLAGPNGAGKTTFYEELLGPATGLQFINADDIAAGRWPGDELRHAYEASELAARHRQLAIRKRQSFITETVFSHPSKLELLSDAKQAGYHVSLHIILIPEQLAVARVANRVEQGGHAVPEEKVRGRYARLWEHLVQAIEVAHEGFVFDNTKANRPFHRVAAFSGGHLVGPAEWPAWTPGALRHSGRRGI